MAARVFWEDLVSVQIRVSRLEKFNGVKAGADWIRPAIRLGVRSDDRTVPGAPTNDMQKFLQIMVFGLRPIRLRRKFISSFVSVI